ncbi:MAG: AI-2E family transporter [Magnetococcales bacterium]|nr:AI-2E family transporter [Magnetococcales bacterium]
MMEKNQSPTTTTGHPYQEGFLLTLLVLAIGGMGWLFSPFLPGLFLAALLAASTYPLHRRILARMPNESDRAALFMTVLMFFLVVSPILYLLVATTVKAGTLSRDIQEWFAGFGSPEALTDEMRRLLSALPIPEYPREELIGWIGENHVQVGKGIGMVLLTLFKGITNNSLAFFASLLLVLFALFFFYREGPRLARQVKILSPLSNDYDDILFGRFTALATVLTTSIIGVAFLQGVSFSLVTAFMGLPWFYLGVAIAAASFIPVVGGVVVWAPTAYVLFLHGRPGQAIFLALWGAIVTGFLIDNIIRPILMGWLAKQQKEVGNGELHVLDYTLFTVLSTFGGLIQFGILGLFFGPILAAMAISVFEVYEMIHAEKLDHS